MASGPEHPALEDLRARVEEEEAAYAEALATHPGVRHLNLYSTCAPGK